MIRVTILLGAKFKFQGASLSNGGSNTGVSAPVMGKLSVNDATAGSCPPGSKLDMALSSFAFYEPYPFCNPMGTSYIRITCEVGGMAVSCHTCVHFEPPCCRHAKPAHTHCKKVPLQGPIPSLLSDACHALWVAIAHKVPFGWGFHSHR